MNHPRGLNLVAGEVTDVRPLAAMFNPVSKPPTVHVIIAAFLVNSFGTTSVYAVSTANSAMR